MKRFLAGILSAVLIIGSIPVYGAENQEIAPQAENIQNTELQQSPEESDHGDSLGDAEGAVEENNPEEGDNSIRNPEEIPAVTEAPELTGTPEQEPEITEVPEEEVPEEENPEDPGGRCRGRKTGLSGTSDRIHQPEQYSFRSSDGTGTKRRSG